MKEYYFFKNNPSADLISIFADSKREALILYNKTFKTNYKFVNKWRAMGTMAITIVQKQDYLHYNFGRWSYVV